MFKVPSKANKLSTGPNGGPLQEVGKPVLQVFYGVAERNDVTKRCSEVSDDFLHKLILLWWDKCLYFFQSGRRSVLLSCDS